MSIKELSASLKKLIDCIDSANLKNNGSLIKSIWIKAKELDTVVSEHSPYEKTLIHDVIALWNMVIDISQQQHDTTRNNDESVHFLTAMVKDTCFQILKRIANQEVYKWIYLEMLISLYSSWLAMNDTNALASVADELRQFDYNVEWSHTDIKSYKMLTSKAYVCLSEYNSKRQEGWEEQLHWIDLAMMSVAMIKESGSYNIDRYTNFKRDLLSFVLHLAVQRRNKSQDSFYWLVNSVSHITTYTNDGEVNCEAEFFHDYQELLLNLLVDISRDNEETISLSEEQSALLLTKFDAIPFQQKYKSTPRYFLSKLYILLAKTSAISGPAYKSIKSLEDEYFCFIEKFKISEASYKEDISMLAVIIFKLSKYERVSLRGVIRGIDLLIQRSKDYREDISSIQNGELYLFKIYILSELITCKAIETFNCAEITGDPFKEESNYLLKSAMDEVYLVKKEEINELNLRTIITLLWRAGDILCEKDLYTISLSLYKHTLGLIISEPSNNENLIVLSYKIASCYEKTGDVDSAYMYFRKGFDSCKHSEADTVLSASDYMTLIKYSLLQTTFSQLIVVPPLIEKLSQTAHFDPNHMMFELIQLCFLHGRKTALLITVLQTAVDCFKKSQMQPGIPYLKMSFIHQLILILRCLVYIKVHKYEMMKGDNIARTKNIDFKSVALYIQRVCQIIQDQHINTIKADPSTALATDLKWLKYTCYNWVIFCYSVGRKGEGGALFVAIERISLFMGDDDGDNNAISDPLTQMLRYCAEKLKYYSESNEEDKKGVLTPEEHFALINKRWDRFLRGDKEGAWMTPYLNSLFRVKEMLSKGKFDEATQVFMELEKSPENPLSVLEYMAAFVLQDPQCPIENAFIIVKKLQLLLVKKDIEDYSKWTRILVSIALNRDSSRQDLYDCLATITNQEVYRKDDYPQNELYYLIVSTWNEGITCYMKQMVPQGQQYCELAFKLLSSYKNIDKRKELEIQVKKV